MKWKNPPESRGSGGRSMWIDVGEQLMKHPNKWALLKENAASANTTHIKNMFLRHCDDDPSHWEVVSVSEVRFDIYGRYLNGEV